MFSNVEHAAEVIDFTLQTSVSILKPSHFPRPRTYTSPLTYSFTKTLQLLLDVEFLRSEGVGWCQFSEVNFSS